jgi:hypothetical protein
MCYTACRTKVQSTMTVEIRGCTDKALCA